MSLNLSTFLNRGTAHAPLPQHTTPVIKSAEASRKQWLKALEADQMRAWMDLGQEQIEVLRGLSTVLALAAYVQASDMRTEDTPDQRVIRGALSAAAQCAEAGAVITLADAKAFSAACDRAVTIIKAGSVSAIIYAATRVRAAAGVV